MKQEIIMSTDKETTSNKFAYAGSSPQSSSHPGTDSDKIQNAEKGNTNQKSAAMSPPKTDKNNPPDFGNKSQMDSDQKANEHNKDPKEFAKKENKNFSEKTNTV
jgi:hypothetical protein